MDSEKQIHEQFEALPLSDKVSSLFKMELATISEAITYVVREPMKVAEKLGDFVTEFGKRVETEFKRASQGEGQPPPKEKKRAGKKSGESGNDSGSA